MKALNRLTNTEKGKLLHDLFPDEMPALLENLKMVCEDFENNHLQYRESWGDGFMPFDYWLGLSRETAELVKRHGHTMQKNSRVFADQLFFRYTSLFVNDRIIKYAENVSKDEKFRQAVGVLYG